MSFEHALWRIDEGLLRLSSAKLENESDLEDYIHGDVRILHDGWLIIGRPLKTNFGGIIDRMDAEQRILSRVWFLDPTELASQVVVTNATNSCEWNG
jgi:hypothetical protein